MSVENFSTIAEKTGSLLENMRARNFSHPVRTICWDNKVLIYKSHIYDDIRGPERLFEELSRLSSTSTTVLVSSVRSYESVYHALLFAYDPNAFVGEAAAEEAAYEHGRRLLEQGEYLKRWYQRSNCGNNVSAPILHKRQSCLMMPNRGKQFSFLKNTGQIKPKLTWIIANGISGARTYPARQKIDLGQRLFTERSGEVILQIGDTKECLDASATVRDVLQSIYNVCTSTLGPKEMSPECSTLKRTAERHYIVELFHPENSS